MKIVGYSKKNPTNWMKTHMPNLVGPKAVSSCTHVLFFLHPYNVMQR